MQLLTSTLLCAVLEGMICRRADQTNIQTLDKEEQIPVLLKHLWTC